MSHGRLSFRNYNISKYIHVNVIGGKRIKGYIYPPYKEHNTIRTHEKSNLQKNN